MAAKGNGVSCSVRFCKNTMRKTKNVSFFRFPSDSDRSNIWVKFTERRDLLGKSSLILNKNYRICSEHFENKYFMNALNNKLVWNAIPTLNKDSSNELYKQNDKYSNTNEMVSCNDSLVTNSITTNVIPNPSTPHSSIVTLSDGTGNEIHHMESVHDINDINIIDNGLSTEVCSINSHFQDKEIMTTPQKRSYSDLLENYNSQERNKIRRKNPSNPSPRTRKKLTSYKTLLSKYKSRYYNMKEAKSKERKTTVKNLISSIPGLSKTAAAFIQCQFDMANRKKNGYRYNEHIKMLALEIYFRSPKCYNLLYQLLKMPSKRSLQNWLKGADVSVGFSKIVLKCITLKVKYFTLESKLCSLCFDEMCIKNNLAYNESKDLVVGFENDGERTSNGVAGYALVFMISGILSNWKLPIGYFFSEKGISSYKLKELLLKCIDLINSTGLKLKSVTSDQGSNNQSLFRSLGITLQNTYIIKNNEKIHFMFDVPHLIKSIRNNFYKYGFTVEKNVILWKYIVSIYEKDKNQNIRAMPKLSNKHVYLPAFSKMKVRFATQILSNTVASIMCTHIACGTLPSDASHTADVILKFDQIFDSLNSSNKHAKNPYLMAISNDSIHQKFFRECLTFIKNLKVNSKKQPPCINGLSLTIMSVINLWDDLNKNYNITYLKTRKLNQDGLENLFSIIRQKSGCNINPTCVQFESALKHLYVGNLFKIANKLTNCEDDVNQIINCLQNHSKSVICNKIPSTFAQTNNSVSCQLDKVTLNFDIIEENAYVYVSGWLAKKISEIHSCEQCHFYKSDPTLEQQNELLTMFKVKNKDLSDFGHLLIPTNEFLNFIKDCESIFIRNVNTLLHEQGVSRKLFTLMKCIDYSDLNVCNPSIIEKIVIFY